MKREGRMSGEARFSFREKEEIYGSSFRVNNICPAAAAAVFTSRISSCVWIRLL